MKVDGGIAPSLMHAAATAQAAEVAGYDGAWTSETSHDPFLAVLRAVDSTARLEIGTAVAVAFARSPMALAVTANDLQEAGGRFILGLGSQIKSHIERRFSMPWSQPAPRMREFVAAMRAIWQSWHEGTKLDFEGDSYNHTLMTPFFDPGGNEFGPPKVFLAGVGIRMTEVAGEMCDLLIQRGLSREAFGKPLLSLGKHSETVSRARIDIEAMRLMVLRAAKAMDVLGNADARVWVSAVKAMVPERAATIIDEAMQLHGAGGISQWTPLAEMYAWQRALRLADGLGVLE